MPVVPPSSRGVTVAQVFGGDAGLMSGLGYKSWNFNPNAIASNSAPTSGTIYGQLVPLVAGVTYTNILVWGNTASAGAAPTGFFVGIASVAGLGSPGTMLAQSANLNGTTFVAGAVTTLALNAPYTETVTGLRFVLILQNGAFGGTNPTFFKSAASLGGATGQTVTTVTAGTGITAFQANGNPILNNYSVASNQPFWVALN